MRIKRVVAGTLATIMLLLPISAMESRARVCQFCGNTVTSTGKVCGGINAEMREITNCDEHSKPMSDKYCKIYTDYGYTVYTCSQGCRVHSGYHVCHVTDSSTGVVTVECPYGDYPN